MRFSWNVRIVEPRPLSWLRFAWSMALTVGFLWLLYVVFGAW